MKLIIDNIVTELVIGGEDHLVSQDLFNELRNYMSVDVPGAFFSRAYKKKVWDGKRYFITPKGKMATGFLPVLLKHIEKEYPDLPVELIDQRGYIPVLKDNLVKIVGDYQMTGKYDHQFELLKSCDHYISFRHEKLYFPRGIIDAATNVGKTIIIGALWLNMTKTEKMLILIHNKTIYKQLVDFLKTIYENVGEINSAVYKPDIITVAMFKSLSNKVNDSLNIRKDLNQYSILIVDECHRAGSAVYSRLINKIRAPVRIFMSGTPFDSKNIVNKMITIGMSGPKLAYVSKKELMDKGVSSYISVNILLCTKGQTYFSSNYDIAKKNLIHYSHERAALIYKVIKKESTPTIVAVREIEHAKFIYNELLYHIQQNKDNIVVEYVYSFDDLRDKKIDDFINKRIDVLISTEILREGVNINHVCNLIYAVGGYDKTAIKQWMGRIERITLNKMTAKFFDFYDIGSYVETHSKKRIRYYKSENLEIIKHYDEKLLK